MSDKMLEEMIIETLGEFDKEKLRSKEYKKGFDDCLKVICKIFGLTK